ncbi:hypothetical protein [Plantactinospora sonchi]|uniref:Uncharacterized protein n=1 Tax=Plantactinospora sonchi TaxID=1544735 RepID=A0ABU7RRB6_9ACTN
MVEDAAGGWAEQRRRAVAAHAAADQRRRAAETDEARQLVAAFVREAQERGLRPTRLTALAYNGRTRYRTALTGWYLDHSRIYAIGVAGDFYLLTVPAGLRARLTGVSPPPQPPKLIIGEGGPDGHSIPLPTLLRQRLDAGDNWP